jgi:hypothetical protein
LQCAIAPCTALCSSDIWLLLLLLLMLLLLLLMMLGLLFMFLLGGLLFLTLPRLTLLRLQSLNLVTDFLPLRGELLLAIRMSDMLLGPQPDMSGADRDFGRMIIAGTIFSKAAAAAAAGIRFALMGLSSKDGMESVIDLAGVH